jgi:hypothetical protein
MQDGAGQGKIVVEIESPTRDVSRNIEGVLS